MLKSGEKVLLLGIGPIISEAIQARKILKEKGINLAIASMGSIKPLDDKFLRQCANEGYSHWITLEEHHKTGGLGSALLEWLNIQRINNIQLKRMGIEDHFVHKLGNQAYVRQIERLDAESIIQTVLNRNTNTKNSTTIQSCY